VRPTTRATWRDGLPVAVGYAAVLLAVVTFGGLRLALTDPHTPTVRVAGVSATRQAVDALQVAGDRYDSAANEARADFPGLRKVMATAADELVAATGREMAAGARIVVWPEAGAQAYQEDVPDLLRRVSDTAGSASPSPRAFGADL
jgi:apolipoprotein N-acyltransferase